MTTSSPVRNDSMFTSTTTSSPVTEKSPNSLEDGLPPVVEKTSRWQRIFKRSPRPKVDCTEPKIITRSLEKRPMGYPRLATFLSSDRSFAQYRGFCALHSRILLALQCEVEQLKVELDRIDQWDLEEGGAHAKKLQCKKRDDGERHKEDMPEHFHFSRTRPQLLVEIKQKLIEYDELLLKARDIAGLQHPTERDWRSVRNWMTNNAPLVTSEQNFIMMKEDLVALRSGRQCAGFESMVERLLARTDRFLTERLNCKIIKYLFLTPELREKTSDKNVIYYAPERVDKLVNVIITAVIFVLLILPVVAMYKLSSVTQRSSPFEAIGILIIFTLLFGMAMSGMTKASRQELFAASAAYCAVLVVFISNFSTQQVEIAI